MLKRVVRVERDILEVRPIEGDKGYAICTGLFNFKAGQVLPLYGGMNEFLSAIVAIRTLEHYLPLSDLIAIVACIEARDAPGAVALMEAHLRELEQRIETSRMQGEKSLAQMLGLPQR